MRFFSLSCGDDFFGGRGLVFLERLKFSFYVDGNLASLRHSLCHTENNQISHSCLLGHAFTAHLADNYALLT